MQVLRSAATPKIGGPAPTLAVVDISNFTGVLSPATVRCWQDKGIRRVIARISTEDANREATTIQQLLTCRDAGMETEGYLWRYWYGAPAAEVRAALAVIADRPVKRLWLDCEERSPFTPAKTVEYIREGVEACEAAGMPTGIYTRKAWWEANTGNSDAFAHLPLWDSEPDRQPTLDGFTPYGGWTARAGKQYKFDAVLCGKVADFNVFRAEP